MQLTPDRSIPDSISREAARTALLVAQGLEHHRPPATKAGLLEAIRRMGQLQIDTIHVVARSPYFVLWSRLGAYEPEWLDELLAEQHIFEAWSHEACFMPVEDYRYAFARMSRPRSFRRWFFTFLEENRSEADALLAFVRERGPVRSSDFKAEPGTSGGWWNWKQEKVLLEALFTEGSLMVARRDRFQRIYDLRERVLPDWSADQAATYEEMVRAHVLQSVKSLGVAAGSWVPDYYRFKVGEAAPALKALAAEGCLLTTQIEGIRGPAYVHPEFADVVAQAAEGSIVPERTTLLSPFDPVVWHRQRAIDLFDFSYLIECYTPAEKRVYGYFSLPILHRGRLAGRLDAKAHRKEGIFEVKSLHLEPWVEDQEQLADDLAPSFRDCAAWHQTPKVVIRRSVPRGFAPQLRTAMKSVRSCNAGVAPQPAAPFEDESHRPQ